MSSTTGKTCLVTGASRGIGRTLATRLSAIGHRVVLTARTEAGLEQTAKECDGPTLVKPADVTSCEQVENLFDEVEREWGTVDILILNAGGPISVPLLKTTNEQWQQMLDVNVTAPFYCVRRAVPAMVEQGYGRVVTVASIAAVGGAPYLAAYTAAKHGVLGLMRSTAAELVRTGVTANTVCPSYVDTAVIDNIVQDVLSRNSAKYTTEKQVRQFLARQQPIGRMITADEVADAVLMCVVNAGMTGQEVCVDGGVLKLKLPV